MKQIDPGIDPVTQRLSLFGFFDETNDPLILVKLGYTTCANILAVVKCNYTHGIVTCEQILKESQIVLRIVVPIQNIKGFVLQILPEIPESTRCPEKLGLVRIGDVHTECAPITKGGGDFLCKVVSIDEES